MPPVVSVVIASERVATLLPECLRALAASDDAPPFEVLVASADEPATRNPAWPFPVTWVRAPSRNPGHRRNIAAARAEGRVLAFIDDDAAAEPAWLAAGVSALEDAEIAGGPDP